MMMPLKSSLKALLGLTLVFNATLFSADYYVDPDGNDTGTGNQADPFRTISRAAELAAPGDTVWIGPGVYRETVRPAQSGQPGSPIVFRSLEAWNPAVINGSDVVDGPWTQAGDGDVFMADWEGEYASINMQADQVFVDGKMVDLLRWPKEINDDLTQPNFGIIDEILEYTYGEGKGAPMTIRESEFNEPDGRWDDARVWVNLSPPDKGDGQGQTGWIVTTDQSDRTIQWQGIDDRSKSTIDSSNNWNVLAGNQYYLFDPTPAGLAATGGPEAALGEREWWLNRETGTLYVRFPEGSNPADHIVEAKRRDWGFDLSEMSHITVRDIEFFATSITTDPEPTGEKPEPTPSTGVILDSLTFRYVTHFTNMDINVDYQGGWMGQSGVIISGSNHVVRNCEFFWSAGSHLSVTGLEHRIYNNLLEDFNYQVTEAAGINMSKDRVEALSLDHKVGYNTLRSSGGAGIFFKTADNSDPDRPGLYRLHNNLIYDVLHNITDAAIMKTVGGNMGGARLDHNILHGGNGYIQFGIYVDFSGGLYLDHNVAYDTWSAIGGNGFEFMLINNNVAIETPTHWAFQPDGIFSGRGLEGPVSLYNNIITGGFTRSFSEATREANIGKSRLNLYPLFEFADDENFTEHDYRLVETATEAIDQGVVVPGFDDPIIGDAPDIGAYEFGREPWKAGYGEIPWYLDDDDTLRFAAQNTTINGTVVLHPFSEQSPVTNLTIVETSPGVTVELAGTSVEPDEGLEIQYTVSGSAPAPATGWFILEGAHGELVHQQSFTFRVLPEQVLDRIEWVDEWEEPVTFFPNARIEFPVEFFDTDGFLMAVAQETQWSVTGGGTISDGKLRTELSQGGPYTLTVQSGGVERSLTFNVQSDWVSGQPVTASSFKNPDVVPENAIDDDEGTPWVSDASDDEWIEIDMGEFVAVETVQIDWHQQLYGSRYELQVSDYGQDWRTLFVAQLDEGGFVTHDAIGEKTGRYFRIQGLERAVNTGYAIYGITVLGDSAAGILGDSLSEPAGWRWSDAVGWFYDKNPGKDSHAVYFYSHGWQHITGPGLFFRSDQFWGYDYARAEWWWYNTYYGRWRFFVSSGWERI